MNEAPSFRARVSQRPSKSCLECRKRKVKCDKQAPCQQCIRQGRPEKCIFEIVQLSTKNTKSRGELEFLRELTTSLNGLDGPKARADAINLVRRRVHLLETGKELRISSDAGTSERETSADTSHSSPEARKDETFATAMALLRLGRGYPDQVNQQPGEPIPSSEILQNTIKELAPERESAVCLIRYYLDHLAWHHPAIHAPTFFEECEMYWATDECKSPLWLALYFAVLSAASWNLYTPACTCGQHDDEEQLRDMCRKYYDIMVKLLYDFDFMSNYSLYAIQAVIIGTMVAHSLGKAKQHMILLSACLRTAQCLGVSHQGQPKPDDRPPLSDQSMEAFNTFFGEEVIRRVWWQLLVQDYFLIPLAGAYGVNPRHWSTPLPRNCDDYDTKEKPSSEPTISSYCIALGKIALLIPELIDGLGSATSPHSVEEQYLHVQHIDAKMRQLVGDLPPFLKPETEQDPNWPPWVQVARTAMTISAADKIIMIHRGFLSRCFQDPVTFAFTRKTCVAASMTILNEFHRIKATNIVKLWIVPTFTVGAAIIIYLDIICSRNQSQSAVQLVWDTVDYLKALSHDAICRRGVYLLETLIEQRSPNPDKPGQNQIKTEENEQPMEEIADTIWVADPAIQDPMSNEFLDNLIGGPELADFFGAYAPYDLSTAQY